MSGYYGAKCIRCTHIEHRGSAREDAPLPWLSMGGLECPECIDCQANAVVRAMDSLGWNPFASEVREAVRAVRDGKYHPLIDELRMKITQEDANG